MLNVRIDDPKQLKGKVVERLMAGKVVGLSTGFNSPSKCSVLVCFQVDIEMLRTSLELSLNWHRGGNVATSEWDGIDLYGNSA